MKNIVLLPIVLLLAVLVLFFQPALAETRERTKEMSALNIAHREMFAMEDFANLDKAMNKIQREYEAGKWSDAELSILFYTPFKGHASEFEEIHNKWVQDFPKSYAARQLRGLYFSRLVVKYYEDALKITKIKTSDDIPSQQAEKIKHYATLAIKDHDTSLKLGGKPILAYTELIDMNAVLGDIGKSKEILAKANNLAPDNVIANKSYIDWLNTDMFYKGDPTLDEMRQLVEKTMRNNSGTEYIEITNIFHLRLLKEGKYAELEKRMGKIQKDYETGKIDDLTLRKYFYDFGFANPDNAEKFDAWVKAHPKSYAAHQIRAMYFLSAAWRARGTKLMKDTSSKEVEGMEHYLERSWKDSTHAATLTAKPILSYRTMVSLLQVGGGRRQIKSTVERANIVDPENSIVRMAYMNSLQTRWGGSLTQMEELLEEVKAIGLPESVIMDFEEWIVIEKRWLAGEMRKNYENIGQLVTGF